MLHTFTFLLLLTWMKCCTSGGTNISSIHNFLESTTSLNIASDSDNRVDNKLLVKIAPSSFITSSSIQQLSPRPVSSRNEFLLPSLLQAQIKKIGITKSQNNNLLPVSQLTPTLTRQLAQNAEVTPETPDFYLYQRSITSLMSFGYSISASSEFLGWSQMQFGFATNAPQDTTYDEYRSTYRAAVSQEEFDISTTVGESKKEFETRPYANYISSLFGNKLLFAGGRGAFVNQFVPDSRYRHKQSQLLNSLKQLNIKIVSCAMGNNFFVLGGYTFTGTEEAPLARQLHVYRQSSAAWVLEKEIPYTSQDTMTAGDSLAAGNGIFFVGDPGKKSVRAYRTNVQENGWTPVLAQFFGGNPGERGISDGNRYGKTLAYSSDGLLAVGAPGSTPSSSHVTNGQDNTGSVFVYRIVLTSSSFVSEFVCGINAPSSYLQSHLIKSSGLLFGASIALSKRMADNKFYLFAGAPGSKGSEVSKESNGAQYDAGGGALVSFTLTVSPISGATGSKYLFQHWLTGFNHQETGGDDHDTGASVAYSHDTSMLFYGAPSAINNHMVYGTGRIYIAAFCKQNEESYSYLRYEQHLRKCRSCQKGYFSTGGRTRCTSCQYHPDSMGQKPTKATWHTSESCVWTCDVGYFGSNCQICSDYKSSETLPQHAQWIDNQATCEWDCKPGYPKSNNATHCIVPSLPDSPAGIDASSATSSTILLKWKHPVIDPSNADVTFFQIQQTKTTSSTPIVNVITISPAPSNSTRVQGPSTLLAPVGASGMWWSYTLTDLIASTAYNFAVRASTVSGYGQFSQLTGDIATTAMTAPSVPMNLTYSRSFGGSIRLYFNRPTNTGGVSVDELSYEANVCESDTSRSCLSPTLEGTTVTTLHFTHDKYYLADVHGLFANKKYFLKIRAKNNLANLHSPWSAGLLQSTLNHATVPSRMMRPILNHASSDMVHVVWTPPLSNGGSPLLGYRIHVYESYDNQHHGTNGTSLNKLVLHNVVTPPFDMTVTGLIARKKYAVTISAYNTAGNGLPSDLSIPIFTAPPIAPTAPQNPRVDEIGSSWLSLKWDAPLDMGGAVATKFTVRLREYPIGSVSATVTTIVVTPTGPDSSHAYTYRLDNLIGETYYDFSVGVSNIVGDSPFSVHSEKSRTNKVRTPGAPGVPVAVATGSDFVLLKWSAPLDSGGALVQSYDIYVSEDGSTWLPTSTGTSITESYRVGNLLASTNFWCYVRATNLAGTGSASQVSSALVTDAASAPSEPTEFVLSASTPTTLRFTWKAPLSNGGSPLTEYTLRAISLSNVLVSTIKLPANNGQIFSGIMKNLLLGTSYSITCQASNKAGHDSPSAKISSASTDSVATVPSSPINVRVITPNKGVVFLQWDAPLESGGVSISKYVVSYSVVGQTSWEDIDVAASTYYLYLAMLSVDLSYKLRAKAVNSVGSSEWSSPLVTITPSLRIKDLSFISVSSNSINIAMAKPASAQRVVVMARSNHPQDDLKTYTYTTAGVVGVSNLVEMTLDGLFASTIYSVTAYASTSLTDDSSCMSCNGPLGEWPTTKSTLPPSSPSPPVKVRLQLFGAGSTHLTLEWDPPVDISGARQVIFKGACTYSAGNVGEVQFTSTSSNTLTVPRLKANTDYTCYVQSDTIAGVSTKAFAPGMLRTLSPSAPGVPGRPIITEIHSGHTILRFYPPISDGGVAITTYFFEMSSNGMDFVEMPVNKFPRSLNIPSSNSAGIFINVTIYRLVASTPYFFRVSAVNSVGQSSFSLPSSVKSTTESTVPSAPQDVNIIMPIPTSNNNAHNSFASLTWNEPTFFGGTSTVTYEVEVIILGLYSDACTISSNIPGYNDKMKLVGMSFDYDALSQSVLPFFARKNSVNDDNYSPVGASASELAARKIPINLDDAYSTFYMYRVRAINSAGKGIYSSRRLLLTPIATTKKPAQPTIIQDTSSSNRNPGEVYLSWKRPSLRGCSPSNYILLRHEKDGNKWKDPIRLNVGIVQVFRETGLAHTTSFRWQLIAANIAGESEASEYTDVITTGKDIPSEVCRFEATSTAMDVVLDWDPPCDDGGAEKPYPRYQVQFWRKNYGGNWNHVPDLPDGVTSYKHTFSREYFNQEFVFQVRATNEIGYGPWKRTSVRMLQPKICSGKSPETKLPMPCSGRGNCHAYDGTCDCEYAYAGAGCELINGASISMTLEGTVEDFDKESFRQRMAKILNIGDYRIPSKLITVQAGSIIAKFAILEENPNNATSSSIGASTALADLKAKLVNGGLLDVGAVSLEVNSDEGLFSDGATTSNMISKAPNLPICNKPLKSDDPCEECLLREGCGYCGGSELNSPAGKSKIVSKPSCMIGGSIGPAIGTGNCPSSAWYHGANAKCPLTPHKRCMQHSTCGSCMVEDRANCAWCASSGKCLSQLDDAAKCPWGWVPDTCVAKCERNRIVTATKGVLWLGDDTKGSELRYNRLTSCKWTLNPTTASKSTYSSSSSRDFQITLTFERVDLGGGDSVIVYDAKNQIVAELYAGKRTEDQIPLQLFTTSGSFLVEFTSDADAVGTGFLASYEAKSQGFWDIYVVVAMSTASMLGMICCFCCWMRCKSEEPEVGRAINNNMGMNLQSTERGALLSNIKKFPKFCFTPSHSTVMKEIGQSESCTICLGDYESDEELRLLPCGHCFHAECVDAWLQINSICPMCKVDVYDLYLQQAKKSALDKEAGKKLKKEKKKAAKAAAKAARKKKNRKKQSGANVIPIGGGSIECVSIPDANKMDGTVRLGSTTSSFDLENNTVVLSPIEQFRMRSRRLLQVNGSITETIDTTVSVGESKNNILPEIEMAVLPPLRVTRVPSVNAFQHDDDDHLDIFDDLESENSDIDDDNGRRSASTSNISQSFHRVPQFMMPPPQPALRRDQPQQSNSRNPRNIPRRHLPPILNGLVETQSPLSRLIRLRSSLQNGDTSTRPLPPSRPSIGAYMGANRK